MKKILVLLFFIIFSSTYAQMDRTIGGASYKEPTTVKKTKTDFVEESVKVLQKKINLDDMQSAMVKIYINESYHKIENIINSNSLNHVEQNAKIEEIEEKLKNDILEILNSEQKEKYKKLTLKKK